MSAFDDLVAAFLDELFELQPRRRHRRRRPSPRRPLAGHGRGGSRGAPRVHRPLGGDAGGARRGVADRRRADRPGPGPGRARVVPLRRDGAARGDVEPAALGLPDRRRAAPVARPRLRAARRAPRVVSGAGSRGSRGCWTRRARSSGRTRRGRSRRCMPRSPRGASAAWRSSRGTRSPAQTAAATTDPDVAALLPSLRAAADEATTALEAMAGHLAQEVVPNVSGPAELGEPLFSAKLRHTLRDPDATAAAVLARAEAEYVAVRAEMVRIAREIWPAWRPGEPVPDDEGALVRGTLDAIAADHPAADDLVAFCREELVRVEAFCRERGRDRPRGRAPPDRLDAGVHALVRRGDAGLAGPARRRPGVVLLDHARPRRVDARRGRVLPARG